MDQSEWFTFQNALRNRIGDEGLESVNRLIEESNMDSNLIFLSNNYQSIMEQEGILEDFEDVCNELNITFRRYDEPER